MRLLKKTNRYNLYFSLAMFIIASGLLFLTLNFIINDTINEKLSVTKNQIKEQIRRGDQIPRFHPIIEVKEVSEVIIAKDPMIIDTLIFDPIEKEEEAYRELSSFENINGKIFQITVRNPIIEKLDYLEAIGFSIAIVFVLLFLGLLFINNFISKKIWSDFYQNLEVLKSFSLEKNAAIDLKPSNITEFKELNEVVEHLTEKAQKDYRSLKEFTENASHELQTPLAIIQSKIELLIQNPNLRQEEADIIMQVNNSVKRLTNLNQSLLLLAKIENKQFTDNEEVDVSLFLEKQINKFEQIAETKNITITRKMEGRVLQKTSPILLEILTNNLLSNALKHNVKNGKIDVQLTSGKLVISNSGEPLKVAPEELFNRFQKSVNHSNSVGLGLAIVKKICDVYGWEISYQNEAELHTLTILF